MLLLNTTLLTITYTQGHCQYSACFFFYVFLWKMFSATSEGTLTRRSCSFPSYTSVMPSFPSLVGFMCLLTDWKHPTKAQLPSFHHGATEDTGRVPAVNTFGGEGNFFSLSLAFHNTIYFQCLHVLEDLSTFYILKHGKVSLLIKHALFLDEISWLLPTSSF